MKTISKERAQQLCAWWHESEHFKLYQYYKDGVFVAGHADRYISEVNAIIERGPGWSKKGR